VQDMEGLEVEIASRPRVSELTCRGKVKLVRLDFAA
jgi:hypothetical protein